MRMKKIITLLLALAGMVSTASAGITIYFTPNTDWAGGNAVFRLNQHNSSTDTWNPSAENFTEFATGVYSATFDNETYDEFKIQRYSSSGDWWAETNDFITTATSKYYIMYDSGYDKWNFYPMYASDYLPCNYYFMSNKSGSWKAVEAMTDEAGTYTYEFIGSDYKGNNISWAPGYAFKNDGTVVDGTNGLLINAWQTAILRPTTSTEGNDWWIEFKNYGYTPVTGSTGKVWYLPSASEGVNEGTVKLSFTPGSPNSARVTCSKSATIGDAGYITYSNSELCTISGATAYKVSANNTTSVTLTEMPAETIWPASEGMILKKTSGSQVTINAVEYGAPATTIGDNYLVGNGNASSTPATGDNIYVFSWDGTNTYSVGFYKATSGTLGAHKAYLDLGRDTFNAREFLSFSFEDEQTGIAVTTTSQNPEKVYNLQGRSVAQPKKGLYIVNGKKVIY